MMNKYFMVDIFFQSLDGLQQVAPGAPVHLEYSSYYIITYNFKFLV